MENKTRNEQIACYIKSAKRIIQVSGNVTDIIWLPCIYNAWRHKNDDGSVEIRYGLNFEIGHVPECPINRLHVVARVGDWLCDTADGWMVLSNEEYNEVMK